MKRKHTGDVAGGAQISEDAALEVDPPRGLTPNCAKPERRVPNRNTRQLLVGVFIITF